LDTYLVANDASFKLGLSEAGGPGGRGARRQGGIPPPPNFDRLIRPGIFVKYFLLFPQKNQRKLKQSKSLNDKIDQNTNFAKLPRDK
jgi:hypothetical protein